MNLAPSETELTIDLNHTKGKGPSDICRDLISKGVSPKTEVKFYRDSTLCFLKPTTIGAWAGMRPIESQDGRPMRFVKV